MNELLEAKDIVVRFGGVVAVNNVSLHVREREICGLIGPNGAGKSTLVDAMSGFERARTGSVHLLGKAVTGLPPHRRARMGLCRTFQNLELFDDLTVAENLKAARSRTRNAGAGWFETVTELFDLGSIQDTYVRGLSHGRRRLVSVARALVTKPAVLLLDEPAAGLDTAETRQLALTLREIRELGVGILLVDHDMSLVMDVCDRVTVLESGKHLITGTPGEVTSDPDVRRAYLGAGVD